MIKRRERSLPVGRQGFTLIELLVVIGIILILTAIVIVAVNPGRQFAQARDAQRKSDLLELTNAIYQFAAEHNGNLPGVDDSLVVSDFPTTEAEIGTSGYNLGAAGAVDGNSDGVDEPLIPTYLAEVPEDPESGTAAATGYFIYVNGDGRVVVRAVSELTGDDIILLR